MTETTLAAIEKTVELDHGIDRVWRAISDPAELAQWFPNTSAEWELREQGEGRFTWTVDGKVFTTTVRIEKLDPPTHLAFTWGHESDDDPTTLVEWTLTARDDGGTTMHVRESGFRTEQHRAGNVEGWDSETAELVAFLDG